MDNPDAERWSSRDAREGREFREFQEVFERTHFHWDLHHDPDKWNGAKVKKANVEDFVFTQVASDPMAGTRTSNEIKLFDDHYFCLLYFERGTSLLRQGANESVIRRNSIALWDSTRPAFFDATEPLLQVSLLIPHQVATNCLPGIEDLCGLEVSGDSGMGAILLSHLRQMHASIDTVAPRDRAAVLRATVELTAAAFRPENQREGGTVFRRTLLHRVQEYILANLADQNLGPQTISEAFGFSPRYLHRLFSEFDMTVSEWIKRTRLERCRYDLADARLGDRSITQIALRNGFGDSSHFSRSFRSEFGISPREHRQQIKLGSRLQ